MFKYYVQFTSPSTLSRGEVEDIGRMITEMLENDGVGGQLYTAQAVERLIAELKNDYRHGVL